MGLKDCSECKFHNTKKCRPPTMDYGEDDYFWHCSYGEKYGKKMSKREKYLIRLGLIFGVVLGFSMGFFLCLGIFLLVVI